MRMTAAGASVMHFRTFWGCPDHTCSATIWMRRRIASPEMFLNAEPLPHVICSRASRTDGGDDEAFEHGDAERTHGRCGRALSNFGSRGKNSDTGRVRRHYRISSQARDANAAGVCWSGDWPAETSSDL